jgi:ParB-like chromosome segregation protein Spo0J
MTAFTINSELRDYLPGVPKQTDEELEASLRANGGPRDRFVVWKGKNILVDGHRRYGICRRLKLPFPDPVEMEFSDIDEVKHWMDTNQGARRNLTDQQERERRARMVAYEKGKNGRGAYERVAEQEGVSTRTVIRDTKYAENLDKLAPDVKKRIQAGELKISRKDLEALATLGPTHQLAVVGLVDRGDYKTVHAAVTGEIDSDPPETTESDNLSQRRAPPPTRPAAEYVGRAQELLGKLGNAIGEANEAHEDKTRFSACQKLMSGLGTVLQGWADALEAD